MWIMTVLSLETKILSNWAQSEESRMKFTNLVWIIADQNFYDIRLPLHPTSEGRSFSGRNIRLRLKVKIVPTVQTVQMCMLDIKVTARLVTIQLLRIESRVELEQWRSLPRMHFQAFPRAQIFLSEAINEISIVRNSAKGQLISEANPKLFTWTKNQRKYFLYFCRSL